MRRLLLAAMITCLPGAAAFSQSTLYVSTTGVDPADCVTSTKCLSAGSPCRTIQCAVDGTIAGDTVRVFPGTYTECFSAFFVQVDPDTGEVIIDPITQRPIPVPADIAIVADDYEVNRRSNTTILDASGLACDFGTVQLGDGAVFRGFTVKGNQGGGGVGAWGAVQITNNVIEGNSALFGGGVYLYNGFYAFDLEGEAIIRSNVVRNNSAAAGGGIWIHGAAYFGFGGVVTVESNTITGNTAAGESGGLGGGLYVYTDTWDPTDLSRVTITKNVIEGNDALYGAGGYPTAYGGGIYASTFGYPAVGSEVIDIDDNVIRQNRAEGYGGGAIAQILGTFGPASASDPGYEVKVENNSITANNADSGGGGLYTYVQHIDLGSTPRSTLIAAGNAIIGNTHTGDLPSGLVPGGGGGVYAEVFHELNTTPGVDVRIQRNTIQNNSSTTVGGGASLWVAADSEPPGSLESVETDAALRFENNLVSGNSAANFDQLGEGGGVHAVAQSRGLATASAELAFNTVADNTVDPGGAAVFVDASTLNDSLFNLGFASLEIHDSILLSNDEIELESGFVSGTEQRTLTVEYNDVFDTAGTLYGPNMGDRTGQNGNQSFEPELSALYVPLLCSPSIDAGDPGEGTRDNQGRLTSELQPNGGIVNLGHLGNTSNAQRTLPDVSGDEIVDGIDVLRIASSFASTSSNASRFNPAADRDKDGDVDGDDLSYVAAFYGQACP